MHEPNGWAGCSLAKTTHPSTCTQHGFACQVTTGDPFIRRLRDRLLRMARAGVGNTEDEGPPVDSAIGHSVRRIENSLASYRQLLVESGQFIEPSIYMNLRDELRIVESMFNELHWLVDET